MRKLIVSIFVLFLSVNIPLVHAQEVTPLAEEASANMRWFCLTPVNANPGNHVTDLNVKEGDGHQDPASYPVSVVVRIALDHSTKTAAEMTEDTSAMTTGNKALDMKVLGGTDGLTRLQALKFANGGIVGGNNPTSIFPVTWKDDLLATEGQGEDRAHYWYGVQEAPVTGDTASGEGGGNQFGTFTFDMAGGEKSCAIIRWDPFGYVFDAITHGPVAGVSVRLLSSPTENGEYTPVPVGVGKGMVGQNPIQTQADGSYRFYVDPGYYKLEISRYSIEKDLTKIKPGYEEFGYEQLYLADTPEVIHELAGKVERRDIAIESIGAPGPFANGPQLKDILMSRVVKDGAQAVRISGMMAQIPVDFTAIYKDMNGRTVAEEKYSLTREHTYVPAGLHDKRNFDIWIPAETTDGTGLFKELKISSKYSGKVLSLPVSPMPSYLNGIAKTSTDIPIIGGTVEVIPLGSDRPSYSVKTDSEGRFEVKTEWIPPMPYELRYKTAAGDVYKISTSEYLRQNASYHSDKKINSFSVQSVSPDKSSSKKGRSGNSNSSGRTQPTSSPLSGGISTNGAQGIVMIVVVILVLILVGVGAFVMMKSRQQQTQI